MLSALLTTIKNSFRRPVTELFPTEKYLPPARFRGKHIFYDSLCIGCSLCAKVCPNNTIIMMDRPEQTDPKLKHRPLIDLNRCIFCGYCAEVCPAKCLFMGNDYEMAATNKADLVMMYPDMIASPGSPNNRRAIYPTLEQEHAAKQKVSNGVVSPQSSALSSSPAPSSSPQSSSSLPSSQQPPTGGAS